MVQLRCQVDGYWRRPSDEHCLYILHLHVWFHLSTQYNFHFLPQDYQDDQTEGTLENKSLNVYLTSL